MRNACLVTAVSLVLVGCVEHGSSPDGGVRSDASGDGANPCGSQMQVRVRLVDWDASAATGSGVPGAQFTLLGFPSVTATTGADGRLELCAPKASRWVFDVDAPGSFVDATAYVEAAAATGFLPITFRVFTAARAPTFFAERGLAFDPNRAQVLGFLTGDGAALSLDRPHGPVQSAGDDGTPGTFLWTAGDGGRYQLFPNVDVTQPSGTVSGDPAGPHVIPLAAGKLTLAAIHFVFLD